MDKREQRRLQKLQRPARKRQEPSDRKSRGRTSRNDALAQEITILSLAALPIVEVRGAIPLGLYFGLPWLQVLILSILGSLIPVFPILWGLTYLTEIFRRVKIFGRFIDWLFKYTRSKTNKLIEEFELLGLLIIFSIPLPGFGVWTGTLAAYLFGIPWRWTFLLALAGTSIASFIVLSLSLGIIRLW